MTESNNLHDSRSNEYSQNGEDGIIAAIFRRIGVTTKSCCEFGAWDGIHLSNCRKLILEGWKALMVEGDAERCKALIENYRENARVVPVNCFVDSGSNSLASLLGKHGFGDLDFLSVDIDGLDHEILESLNVRPRVICIEVNAGHDPRAEEPVERGIALENVGQPLSVFARSARRMGYDLVCFNGNAFFVRSEDRARSGLPSLTCEEAYGQYLGALDEEGREWMYLVNLGLVNPCHRFGNSLLSRESLGLGGVRAFQLRLWARVPVLARILRKLRAACSGGRASPASRPPGGQ